MAYTMEAIREKYPRPDSGEGEGDGGYCVGGALCQALGMNAAYPLQ